MLDRLTLSYTYNGRLLCVGFFDCIGNGAEFIICCVIFQTDTCYEDLVQYTSLIPSSMFLETPVMAFFFSPCVCAFPESECQ